MNADAVLERLIARSRGRGLSVHVEEVPARSAEYADLPIDQFLMGHPGYVFAQNPEQAVIDPEKKVAFVEKRQLDYYTQAVQTSRIHRETTDRTGSWRACEVGFGDATVSTELPMFKKVKFQSRDSLGWEKLELPPK